MILLKEIDRALEFYNIDIKYRSKCVDLAREINNSDDFTKAFDKVYKRLYYNDFSDISDLWELSDVNELFKIDINPFVTNLMILLGSDIHNDNMKKHDFDDKQIVIHKKRVKECFESDLKNRGYKSVRISQMLWATYFTRARILEVGRLQFEYATNKNNQVVIKIHIPRGDKLDISSVKKSIDNSKREIEKVFKVRNCEYICNSWLLSNQIFEIVDENTNISKFHELFDVKDGDNCIKDILDFVYEDNNCKDYSKLLECTSLQKEIKKHLLSGDIFKIGLGVLKYGR